MTEFFGDEPLGAGFDTRYEVDIVEPQRPTHDPADCADVVRGLGEPIGSDRQLDALRTGFGGLLQWYAAETSGQAETGAADESAALE